MDRYELSRLLREMQTAQTRWKLLWDSYEEAYNRDDVTDEQLEPMEMELDQALKEMDEANKAFMKASAPFWVPLVVMSILLCWWLVYCLMHAPTNW